MGDSKKNNNGCDEDNNKEKDNLIKILSEKDNIKKIEEMLKNYNVGSVDNTDSNGTVISDITRTAAALTGVNVIKQQICRLPLDLCQRAYFDENVAFLLSIIDSLSLSAYNLMATANYLSLAAAASRKESNIRDIICTSYEMDKQCIEVYEVLRKRIKILLKE